MSNILEPVLSTVLIDMINAQNEANLRSAQLAEKYFSPDQELDIIQFFDVPNATIKNFTLDMKFALGNSIHPLGGQKEEEVKVYIERSVENIVNLCLSKYDLFDSERGVIKSAIFRLWRKEKVSLSEVNKEKEDGIITDIKNELDKLKQEIYLLAEHEIKFSQHEDISDLKAIFNVSDLKNYNGDIMCSIIINAEVTGLKSGFKDEFEHVDGVLTRKRKIYMMG